MTRRRLPIIRGTTCYDAHAQHKVACNKQSCRLWINHADGMNCAVITAKRGPHTLQQIGDIFGVSRMRICQLESEIIGKFRTSLC